MSCTYDTVQWIGLQLDNSSEMMGNYARGTSLVEKMCIGYSLIKYLGGNKMGTRKKKLPRRKKRTLPRCESILRGLQRIIKGNSPEPELDFTKLAEEIASGRVDFRSFDEQKRENFIRILHLAKIIVASCHEKILNDYCASATNFVHEQTQEA